MFTVHCLQNNMETHLSHLLHPHASDPLHVLAGEVRLPVLLPLGEGHVQWLGHDDAAVHLRHCLRGLFGRRETDEAESLRPSLLRHDFGGRDSAEGTELLSQTLVVDRVVEVLDVEVDALVAIHAF